MIATARIAWEIRRNRAAANIIIQVFEIKTETVKAVASLFPLLLVIKARTTRNQSVRLHIANLFQSIIARCKTRQNIAEIYYTMPERRRDN